MSTAKYLWLDLETTGLDPTDADILECAAIITDAQLVQIGEPFEMVMRYTPAELERTRRHIDDVVFEMHRKSGLWEACHAAHGDHIHLGQALGRIILEHAWAEGKPVLAGSTIAFDRSFLKEWTGVADLCHYRLHDVSSLRMAAIDVYGGEYKKSSETHRALADIQESLRLARQLYAEFGRGAEQVAR